MITLKNGDKWIIDGSEYDGIDYKEACKGNIPKTGTRDFVEKLCKARGYDNKNRAYIEPRKLVDCETYKSLVPPWDGEPSGYWDCNFDVFNEVLGSVAVYTKSNPWSTIYEMPWGSIIVVFQRADCGGYDVEIAVRVYDCYSDYLKDVVKTVE